MPGINFKGKQLTFMGIVMCRLIPAAALVVPFYLIVQAAGLLDNMLADHRGAQPSDAAVSRC